MQEHRGWYDREYLPHCDIEGVSQFVTFRLADALPTAVLKVIADGAKNAHREEEKAELCRLSEKYLDSGFGECLLANSAVAEIMKATLLHKDQVDYILQSWVIMPNHVHILFRPEPGNNLERIVQAIKSVSAHKINRELNRHGQLWQREYFDRYMRDEVHFNSTVGYIEMNPVVAGLVTRPEEWLWSSAFGG